MMEWDKLWATNKKAIDPISPRYNAIAKESAVEIELENGPEEVEGRTMPLHPKDPSLGNEVVLFYKSVLVEEEDAKELQVGKKVTLLRWCNCVVDRVE